MNRISESDEDLQYDKKEWSALTWAIKELTKMDEVK